MAEFDLVKKEVESILPSSPLDFELKHSELVLKWVLSLEPDADEALKIAAISHNILSYLKRNGRERTKEKIKFMYKRLSAKA